MSYYSEASLVMIPSGIKDGKLYSAKPVDGSGDLTFSRGSDIEATRVASNGYIQKAAVNLLLQSNSFSTTWTATNATLTSGQSGYDGTNDAWKVEAATTSTTRIYQSSSIAANTLVTMSVYAKVGNVDFIKFSLVTSGTNSIVTFDLTDGTIYNSNAIDESWESIGGGWVRISAAFLNSDAITDPRIEVRSSYSTATCDAGSFVYIQDAQINYGLVAQEYQETTTTSVITGITNDMPRLDYSGGASCPSLLLEPQRTNILESSEFVQGSGWSLSGTPVITQNFGTSPEGVQNSVKIEDDNSGGFEAIANATTLTSGTSYSASLYIKKATSAVSHYAGFTIGGFPYIIIDNFNGTTNTTGGTGSWSSIEMNSFNNDWWLFTATMTATVSGTASYSVWPAISSNGTTIDSSATGSQEFYGFQLEAGSYPTSYIPCYGTSATRLKDACSKTGISSLIGSESGTMYLEASALADDLSERRIALSDGTNSNVARIGFTNVSNRILAVLYNGTNQCVLVYDGADITQTNKIAFTWAVNDFALFVNGVKRSSDVFGTTFAANTLTRFGFDRSDGAGNHAYGNFDQVLLFKSRLSDSDLATLTA